MPPSRQPKFPPLTVSRAALLQGGRDDAFRDVIQDLVDFSSRLAQIRETLARQVGLSPPQYRLLMELAHWSQTKPTVGEIAEALNVSLPFITTETRRLPPPPPATKKRKTQAPPGGGASRPGQEKDAERK